MTLYQRKNIQRLEAWQWTTPSETTGAPRWVEEMDGLAGEHVLRLATPNHYVYVPINDYVVRFLDTGLVMAMSASQIDNEFAQVPDFDADVPHHPV